MVVRLSDINNGRSTHVESTIVQHRTFLKAFRVKGLKPNGLYTFHINGFDMTWQCQQPHHGRRLVLGSGGIYADSTGDLQWHLNGIIEQGGQPQNGLNSTNNVLEIKNIDGKTHAFTIMPSLYTARN